MGLILAPLALKEGVLIRVGGGTGAGPLLLEPQVPSN